MKMPRLKLSFRTYNDSAFETKAQVIVAAVTLYFENPTPEIATLLEAISAFSDALTAAGNGDRLLIAEKNRCRKILEGLLLELAAFVTLAAKGDRDKLIKSAFDLHKEAEPKPAVTAPTSIKVTSTDNPGEVLVKVTGAKNVKHYRHEYAQAPVSENTVWKDQLDSRREFLFQGLKPGTEYIFRSAAVGLRGAKAYSKTVSHFVQG